MYENRKELLSKLEFGSVDSESELDLDRKFIKTKDFEQFINPQKSLVLGAKGSGKSALFQMFSKYEEVAKKVKKAFSKVSEVKCDTYLSEFPKLRKHFDRFRGKDTAQYSREEIFVLMDGLEPQGDDMLQELYETGMLEAKRGKAFADDLFEIPKLYRIGLGLVLRGRP